MLAFSAALGLEAQQNELPAIVRGLVVDAATGAPLSRVLVADITQGDSGRSAVTAVDGRFDLTLTPGLRRLRASVVGYSLVERDVTLAPGVTLDLTIPLVGGTGFTEAVTVSAERFRHVTLERRPSRCSAAPTSRICAAS